MNFCRCDNPEVIVEGMCDSCQLPMHDVPTELLHKPPPPFSREPQPVYPDPKPWRVCPDCGVENNEHKPRCPRANWNVNKYTPPRT